VSIFFFFFFFRGLFIFLLLLRFLLRLSRLRLRLSLRLTGISRRHGLPLWRPLLKLLLPLHRWRWSLIGLRSRLGMIRLRLSRLRLISFRLLLSLLRLRLPLVELRTLLRAVRSRLPWLCLISLKLLLSMVRLRRPLVELRTLLWAINRRLSWLLGMTVRTIIVACRGCILRRRPGPTGSGGGWTIIESPRALVRLIPWIAGAIAESIGISGRSRLPRVGSRIRRGYVAAIGRI